MNIPVQRIAVLLEFAGLVVAGAGGIAHAATLDTYAGGAGGITNGSIAAGCFTSGTPSELRRFFRGGSFPQGGIAACGLTGGLNHDTGTAGTAGSSLTIAPFKLYGTGRAVCGGVGVSGDTSCADHRIARRMRNELGLDHLLGTGGVSGDTSRPDNIVYLANGEAPNGFKHPNCGGGGGDVPGTLPAVQP